MSLYKQNEVYISRYYHNDLQTNVKGKSQIIIFKSLIHSDVTAQCILVTSFYKKD